MFAAIRSVASLLLGAGILILGNALIGITLPIRMDQAEYGRFTSGLVMSAYYVGLLVGCIFAPRLTARIGHVRAFATYAAFLCAATLLHALWFSPLPWAVFRGASGFCMAALFNVIESWLSSRATNETRGGVLAGYGIFAWLAAGLGYFLVNSSPVNGPEHLMLAALLLSVSMVPVVLTRVAVPDLAQAQPLPLGELYALSPLGIVGACGAGLMAGAFFGMGPVFGSDVGLTQFQTSMVLGLAIFGGLLLQWPLGRLSDRFDRRTILFAVLLAQAVICGIAFATWTALQSFTTLIVLVFLFGGTQSTLYPVSVAHAFDYVHRDRMIAASAGLLLAWATGACAGPLLASVAMEVLGSPALFLFLALLAAAVAAFTRYRMIRRAPLPPEEQAAFVPLPATTAAG
ncbi:MAG TPA: MFS transporter, partial [Dongiaceae bacterium]